MNESVLDLKEFLDRVQDDKDLLLELLDIFDADFKVKRKLLKIAVEKKDFEEIRGIAHSFKGASGNISAKSLRIVCMKLEDMGKNQNISGIDELLVDLDKQFDLLLIAMAETKKEFNK